ncbi:hypothetical protein [Caballeronia sp. AZ7_KS35]|uniref:hypothetical protein n=1 Tax=Caballeronia sp. AZ7_KS35 TaxID=2921762 RepID=UPI0020286A6E|nr:hypothetical protein [Caballeronia sp. AZ7_KS35]
MRKSKEVLELEAEVRREDEAVEAEDQERARKAEAKRIADEIKHGITPDKKTVPTQIRILQSQIDDLKVISGMERTNISAILRLLIADYILEKREDETIRQALDWAEGGRRAVAKFKAEQDAKKEK